MKISKMIEAQLRSTLIALAEGYHARIRPLYTSQRASVAWGPGGQTRTDWHAYARSYGFPANWRDAGVRLVAQDVIRIETARGTLAAEIPLALLPQHPLCDGDGALRAVAAYREVA